MFKVEGNKISISKGDTGSLTVHTNGTFESNDRAVFTIATKGGEKFFEEEYALTNGSFSVSFENEVTDKWNAGTHKWQIRYVWSPVRDQNDKIIGGTKVKTVPEQPNDFVVSNVLSEF